MFEVRFKVGWDENLSTFDFAIRKRIAKKIEQLQFLQSARHLKHGLPYFVVEVSQYRIIFEEAANVRKIMFVGNHKQYESWVHQFE